MKKTGLIITAYCDSDEKQLVLYNLIKKIKDTPIIQDYFLIVSSHTPVELKTQEVCDYTIYEKENQIDERKYSHGAAECNLINAAFQILEHKGIEETFKLTYDMILDDITIFEKWKQKNKKLVIAKWHTWGLGAYCFYTNIKFFKQAFHLFKTVDEMFKYAKENDLTYYDGTVLLEKIWVDDLLKTNNFNNLYIYFDTVEMMNTNRYCNLYLSDDVYKKLSSNNEKDSKKK